MSIIYDWHVFFDCSPISAPYGTILLKFLKENGRKPRNSRIKIDYVVYKIGLILFKRSKVMEFISSVSKFLIRKLELA